MEQNRHQHPIPLHVLQQAQTKLDEAKTLLSPYVETLTPEERRDLYAMGDKSVAFVEKSYDFAVQNPSLVPSYLDMTEFSNDKTDAVGLWTLLNTSQQVTQGISDTAMTAGGDALHEALIFYNHVKYAASQDVYGAKAIYEELRKRFPHGRHKKNEKDDKAQ
jgi:hypothetical protein